VIYKLDELGDDLDLGKWNAETIPEVIEPGTWKGQGVLRYYGPKKILVIYHTAAVQAKVDGFLKSVKTSTPTAKAKTLSARKSSARDQGIVPAQYRAPASLTTSNAVPEPTSSYPVATPVRQPKHLFHFIIRYEGDGIIDDNVVKFMKAQYQSEKSKSTGAPVVSTNVLGAAVGAGLGIVSPPTVSYAPSPVCPAPSLATPPVGRTGAELPSAPATSGVSTNAGSLSSATVIRPSSPASTPVAPASGKQEKGDKKAEKKKKEDKSERP